MMWGAIGRVASVCIGRVLRRFGVVLGLASLGCLLFASLALAAPVFTQVPGSPFSDGSTIVMNQVAFSPDGRFLAADGSTLSVFSVAKDGALNQVASVPAGAPGYADSVAFSPAGGLLAMTNDNETTNTGAVYVYSVGSDGSLTGEPGSPYRADTDEASVAFSPDGKLLATGGAPSPSTSDTVSLYSVADGVLTRATGARTGTGTSSVAFSPGGGLLATANDDNTVSVFRVTEDGTLSTLTQVGSFATGRGPFSVAFSQDGRWLATADFEDDTVSVFSVASDGTLTPVSGSPFPTGNFPESVAFGPSGLLASNNANDKTVSVVSVASNGGLTPISGHRSRRPANYRTGLRLTPAAGCWRRPTPRPRPRLCRCSLRSRPRR
jgi:WD40 repeat protein